MKKLSEFYCDKTVLITGHTGFKGSWLAIWLYEMGANVIGYGLDPITKHDNFVLSKVGEKITDIRGDIRDLIKLKDVFNTYKPHIVFHLAAQPLVRESYKQPIETYTVNVLGTINVLECIRDMKTRTVGVFITTDKCYENKEQIWGYKECDALGGYDPYSSSKAAAEIAIQSWRQSFMNPKKYVEHNKAIASVRAGNVIGGGDWAEDRIIPDCIKAIENNKPIKIRNQYAIRPWQHVLEPLRGYLMLAKLLWTDPINYSEAWNFGPTIKSVIEVGEIAQKVVQCYGKGKIEINEIEYSPHETQLLNLDSSKSMFKLGWETIWDIDAAIYYTVDWYRRYEQQDMYGVCREQIKIFTQQNGIDNDVNIRKR